MTTTIERHDGRAVDRRTAADSRFRRERTRLWSVPSGAVVAVLLVRISSSSESLAVPDLSSVALTREPQTVGSTGSGDTEFRVAARTAPTGERIVVAVPLNDTRQTINRLLLVETIVILFVLLVLGIAAWLLVGIGLRPLDRMGRTADAIAGGDLSHRVEPADERSEIGRLGLALNRMLHRLEGAFKEREASENRLRQFLADASHELRTPLVSIRGYSELYRLGATQQEDDGSALRFGGMRPDFIVPEFIAWGDPNATP